MPVQGHPWRATICDTTIEIRGKKGYAPAEIGARKILHEAQARR